MSVTEDALALAFRSGLPFVGLRDHAHDPDLDRLIPPDAARTARAIPLTADADRIRLAVADPDTDLSPLDRYLAGREVALALAPSEEIDKILGPPPPETSAPIATEEPDVEAVQPEEPELHAEAEPEPLATEPDPLIAEPVPPPAAQREPESLADATLDSAAQGAADPGPETLSEEGASTDGAATEVAATAEGESRAAAAELERVDAPGSVGADEAAPPGPSAAEPELVVAAAQPESGADDELAGEVPSWLEPRRRRWLRVVLTVLFVLVVLGLAAVAVVAFVNA